MPDFGSLTNPATNPYASLYPMMQAGAQSEQTLRDAITSNPAELPPEPEMQYNQFRNPWTALGMALMGRGHEAAAGAAQIDAQNKRRMDEYNAQVLQARNYDALRQQNLNIQLANMTAENAQRETNAKITIDEQILARDRAAKDQKLKERQTRAQEATAAQNIAESKARVGKLTAEESATRAQTKRQTDAFAKQYGMADDESRTANVETFIKAEADKYGALGALQYELSIMGSTPTKGQFLTRDAEGNAVMAKITPEEINLRERQAIDTVNYSLVLTPDNKAAIIMQIRQAADTAREHNGIAVPGGKVLGPVDAAQAPSLDEVPGPVGTQAEASTPGARFQKAKEEVQIQKRGEFLTSADRIFDFLGQFDSTTSDTMMSLETPGLLQEAGVVTPAEAGRQLNQAERAALIGRVTQIASMPVNQRTNDDMTALLTLVKEEFQGRDSYRTKDGIAFLEQLGLDGRTANAIAGRYGRRRHKQDRPAFGGDF